MSKRRLSEARGLRNRQPLGGAATHTPRPRDLLDLGAPLDGLTADPSSAVVVDLAELRALDTGNAPLFDLVAIEAELVAAFGPPSRRRPRRRVKLAFATV